MFSIDYHPQDSQAPVNALGDGLAADTPKWAVYDLFQILFFIPQYGVQPPLLYLCFAYPNDLFDSIVLWWVSWRVSVQKSQLIHAVAGVSALMKRQIIHYQQNILEWVLASKVFQERLEFHLVYGFLEDFDVINPIFSWNCQQYCMWLNICLPLVQVDIGFWQSPHVGG